MTLRPLLITVNGTGVPDPYGPGFAADLGRAFQVNPWRVLADQLDGLVTPAPVLDWQPIGYPAAVFPMNPSVQAGRSGPGGVVPEILARPVGTPLFLSGYSQGAIVVGEVWSQDILSPTGVLHDRLPDVKGIINFGDPLRCPGVANGNVVAGVPLPKILDGQTTGGIGGPACLTLGETPEFLLSCALDGDLYASAPVGANPWTAEAEVGKVETRIYQLIEEGSFTSFLGFAQDIADEFKMPLSTTIALVQAIVNGIGFAAQGTNAPHWQYGPFIGPMVSWIVQKINSI